MQRLRTSQGLSYAEAAKRLVTQPNKNNMRTINAENNTMKPCEGCSKIEEDTLTVFFKKSDFILFMVDVINCSAQTDKNTEKIKIIVNFLGIKGFGWKEVEEGLNSLQSLSWSGGYSWS